ncbi:Purine nucleoside phosphorylase [Taenia crassiceps]|uniref:Purine nucleoside phosphorylase n=1 Tax=Taenia crassiceps TaxID=6207 RepID=A0ABR4Q313_9CEST
MAMYQQAMCATDYLRSKVHYRPVVGIICGSGLGGIADLVGNPRMVRYDDIPGFPDCEVIGNEGKFIFGDIGGKHVVVVQRRLRTYEGHDYSVMSAPIRVIRLLGVKYLFVTTTAGGLNPSFKVGDLVVVKDHVDFSSLVGHNPLIGPHDPRFGDRFPTLLGAYDRLLRDLAAKSMRELRLQAEMLEGVYFHIAGPAYETPATARMLQLLGCDVMGMSLTQEVLVAKHQHMKIFALCLVTNKVTTDSDATDNHSLAAELHIAKKKAPLVGQLIERIILNTPVD